MVTISSIQQKEVEKVCREFFKPDYADKRLGSGAIWLKEGAPGLGLTNSISFDAFHNLTQGLSPDGTKKVLESQQGPQRVALWQLDFVAPPSVTALWAMAPGTQRWRMESAHMGASMETLRGFDFHIEGPKLDLSAKNKVYPLGAFFTCGAAQDESPQLKSTAFVLTHGFLKDGSTRNLTAGDLAEQERFLGAHYSFAVRNHLAQLIGPFKQISGIQDLRLADVPQEFVRKFYYSPSFNSRGVPESGMKQPDELAYFAKWREQAKSLGWGMKEAKALLRESARRKYWADMKSDVLTKIQETALPFLVGQRLLKAKVQETFKQKQKTSDQKKTNAHKHSH